MGRKEDALGVCDHVAYEIKMFVFCIKELIEWEIDNKPENNFKNALVESFAIHFRNLYAFFKHKEKKKCKEDFNDNNVYYFDIKNKRYNLNSSLEMEYNKACKGIAHIDRDRTELKKDGWNYRKLYNVFKPPILEFINDPEILSNIKEKELIPEIMQYCDRIDYVLNDLSKKGLTINNVDTTSVYVDITSSFYPK